MSLSSEELNYLIWRYLQEGGFELAAYALQKESSCADYEHGSNKLVPHVGPGCLVSLVQKGILYTFLEDASEGKTPRLTLPDAVMREKEELENAGSGTGASTAASTRAGAGTGAGTRTGSGAGVSGIVPGTVSGTIPGTAPGSAPDSTPVPGPESDSMLIDQDFETVQLSPSITIPPSLCSQWHPSTNVVAVGNDDSSAYIHALKDGAISETVKLSHPPMVQKSSTIPNSITCVSWSPLGTMVLTAGANGELRAWTPDGRLKNLVNGAVDSAKVPAPVVDLLWNSRGSLVLAVDMGNTVSIYEGVALTMVSELRLDRLDRVERGMVGLGNGLERPGTGLTMGVERPGLGSESRPGNGSERLGNGSDREIWSERPASGEGESEVHACWISDHKFALTNNKNHIQIFSVNAGEGLVAAGQLAGHEHVITNLTFSSISKLLASASDVDYVIRVWNSQSSHDSLELNVVSEKVPDLEYHGAPILELCWLSRAGDIQGNLLLSVSMEGTVNLWDAFTGDALVSANIFKNPENFRYSGEPYGTISTKNALVYAAAVSPDSDYLAIGDDSGAVSIWDIQVRGQTHGVLRCLGVFCPKPSDADTFGICDLAWNKQADILSVSYKGGESVMLEWRR